MSVANNVSIVNKSLQITRFPNNCFRLPSNVVTYIMCNLAKEPFYPTVWQFGGQPVGTRKLGGSRFLHHQSFYKHTFFNELIRFKFFTCNFLFTYLWVLLFVLHITNEFSRTNLFIEILKFNF